jgi:2-keto-4-pentenoate hydratase/2-oxohepta-3-ene-1,7-dioic acid hydratase in catechol pathway
MRLMRIGDLSNERPIVMSRTPPAYLHPGDRMELGIDRLGRQQQNVIAAP